jgi:hypothetical protein
MEGNENAKLNRKTERKDETAGLHIKYVKTCWIEGKKTGHTHENNRIFLLLHVVK